MDTRRVARDPSMITSVESFQDDCRDAERRVP